MTRRAGRGGAIEAGAIAGIAGLVVFLVLHHLWIVPIWFIAPVGAVMAALGGAAVGAAYGELLPRLPPRPWTSLSVIGSVAAILTPSIVAAELSGPIYAMGLDGEGTLLVSAPEAITAFVVGLLGTATLTGAALGATVGRTPRAATTMALAGLALALGPGHNIPLLGGTPAAVKELTVLVIVVGVASLVLVESQAWMARRAAPSASIPLRRWASMRRRTGVFVVADRSGPRSSPVPERGPGPASSPLRPDAEAERPGAICPKNQANNPGSSQAK